jgi:phosphoserine phosphatase
MSSFGGTYVFDDGPTDFKIEAGHLVAVLSGGRIVFFAESATKFFDKTWGIELEFSRNAQGDVASIIWRQDGKDDKGIRK